MRTPNDYNYLQLNLPDCNIELCQHAEDQVKSLSNKWVYSLHLKGFIICKESSENYRDNYNRTITDLSTRLIWEKDGSEKILTYKEALTYINNLNEIQYLGYTDWRLPTLEEGISILQASKCNTTGLFINPLFAKQKGIWTSDKSDDRNVWVIRFQIGCFGWVPMDSLYYVKACRQ